MALAKPVIGTREPAPANFPILLKIFKPVKNALKKINIIETTVLLISLSKPRDKQNSNISCPIVQTNPTYPKCVKTIFKYWRVR